ncbi:28S ribosomal protein S31, mitochondrial [Bombus vosnesenskii]|uniref:Small ribosomal subunit protein mS31 n=1 Tax=Bombus vosnesenskii TaxID=207650 RepID=A0A6J3K317_9HYME|nr:28S ribosomal protein S31, mitochondrial [Bombus vosnesenskii]
MLATFFLSKSTKTQIILPFQRLNITFNVIRTNLSSSSSDSSSSDSDSDAEISNEIRDKLRGIDYLQSAKTARKRRQIEHELTKAAQILTTTSDQDKGKILSVLLDNISKIQTIVNTSSKSKEDEAKDKTRTINNESKEPQKLSTIRKLQSRQKEVKDVNDKFERKYERQKEPSIIEMLKSQSSMRKDIDDKFEMKYERRMEPSIIHKLQSQQKEVRDVSDKFERKYERQKEPSIIEMLKSQSSMRKDIDDKFEMKYERRMEPSIIHNLKSQQKEVRDVSDKFERKYERQKEPSIIEMLKSQSSMRKDIDDKFQKEYERRMEPSVIHKLQSQQKEVRDASDKFERKYERQKEPSMIEIPKYKTLRKSSVIAKLMSQQKGSSIIDDNERDNIDYERIFDDFPENTDVPKLKMWDTWEREQLQFLTSKYPTNAFQEMIQWSKEGKLWKFPIDNEQGMEKEQNVHFSKHVFLERELIPWCPPKGPIRHFMELVCVGLSKNPYMTIEEKYNHIMWYKNYFNDKHDVLEKLGILE